MTEAHRMAVELAQFYFRRIAEAAGAQWDVLAYARRVNAEAEQDAERQRQAEADQETLW
jgi:hypothetical protein